MGKSNYAGWQASLAPTFLARTWGQAWLYAHGMVRDYLIRRLHFSIYARMPLRAPADALAALGAERGMIRGLSETDAAYAARVQNAWTAWPWAGTPYGILTQLSALGYPRVVLAQVRGRMFQLDATGALVVTTLPAGSWEVDAPPQSFWSKFQVLFVDPFPVAWLAGGFAQVHFGTSAVGALTLSGAPTSDLRVWIKISQGGNIVTARFQASTDYGQTWTAAVAPTTGYVAANGLTIAFPAGTYVLNDVYQVAPTFNVPADGSAEASRIKAVVNQWKPAHSTCVGYAHLKAGSMFGYFPTLTTPNRGVGFIGGSTVSTWAP